MKIILAEINTIPYDFEWNFCQIKEAAHDAYAKTDVIVYPEMAVCGYLCKDMVLSEGFAELNLKYLNKVAEFFKEILPNTFIVIGYVEANHSGIGKPFYNSAAVIRNGFIVANYRKHLLPFYDVFDEGRYFEPGKELAVVEIGKRKFGITVCEDIWNDKEGERYYYQDNPVYEYRKIGVKNIINISASPYWKDKPKKRNTMLSSIASFSEGLLIYVSQVGGHDELVFDSCSNVFGITGATYLLHERKLSSGSNFFKVDINRNDYVTRDVPTHGDMVIMGLKDYVRKNNFSKVVIGSSGGIDSALTLCLACESIGAENVYAIMMPSIYSSESSTKDAKELHKNLGCNEIEIPIEHMGFIEKLQKSINPQNDPYDKVADQNIQARLRGMTVMYFSNAFNALPLTTGNKTELAVGYCTLYGDMNGGFNAIGDLYKMEVYDIAEKRYSDKIPKSIIDKAPSAELTPGQKDENDLPPYHILDEVVRSYVEDFVTSWEKFNKIKEISKEEYQRMINKINFNEYKRRQAAPCIKVSKMAFGTGRRIPIVKGMMET